jgi:hypothetical protein
MPPGREFAGLSLCRTVALRALCDYSERMKQYVKHRKVVKMGCYEEVQCEGGLDINIEQFNGKPAVELLIRPLAHARRQGWRIRTDWSRGARRHEEYESAEPKIVTRRPRPTQVARWPFRPEYRAANNND